MLHEQSSKQLQAVWQPSDDIVEKRGWVKVQGTVLIPAQLVDTIAKHGIRLDYEYVKENGENKQVWKFDKNQSITYEHWPWERINAMRVLAKLEK